MAPLWTFFQQRFVCRRTSRQERSTLEVHPVSDATRDVRRGQARQRRFGDGGNSRRKSEFDFAGKSFEQIQKKFDKIEENSPLQIEGLSEASFAKSRRRFSDGKRRRRRRGWWRSTVVARRRIFYSVVVRVWKYGTAAEKIEQEKRKEKGKLILSWMLRRILLLGSIDSID